MGPTKVLDPTTPSKPFIKSEPLGALKKRLNDLHQQLTLEFAGSPVMIGSVAYWKVSNLIAFRNALIELHAMDLFPNYTSFFMSHGIASNLSDFIDLQEPDYQMVKRKYNDLQIALAAVTFVLHNNVPDQDPNSLNIKLPTVHYFDELETYSNQLHKALSQVVSIPGIDGQAEIVSVDNGSIWLNVLIGSAAAMTVIGNLIHAAYVISRRKNDDNLTEQHVRGLKIKNEAMDIVKEGLAAEMKIMIESEAKLLNDQHLHSTDAEVIGKLKMSIDIFSNLIIKGAEIQPALGAPKEIATLFPDATKLIGLVSKIKRITDAPDIT